jgi:hypothetical protein
MFKLAAIFFVAILLTACGSPSRAPNANTAKKESVTEFGARYAKAWSSKDPESVAQFFADSAALKVNNDKPAVGREEITRVARSFMTAFPDLVVTMDKLVPTANGAEFHWTLAGTNSGPGGRGNRVKISGYEEWRIGPDGLIADSKGHFDEAEYKRQIETGVK